MRSEGARICYDIKALSDQRMSADDVDTLQIPKMIRAGDFTRFDGVSAYGKQGESNPVFSLEVAEFHSTPNSHSKHFHSLGVIEAITEFPVVGMASCSHDRVSSMLLVEHAF